MIGFLLKERDNIRLFSNLLTIMTKRIYINPIAYLNLRKITDDEGQTLETIVPIK